MGAHRYRRDRIVYRRSARSASWANRHRSDQVFRCRRRNDPQCLPCLHRHAGDSVWSVRALHGSSPRQWRASASGSPRAHVSSERRNDLRWSARGRNRSTIGGLDRAPRTPHGVPVPDALACKELHIRGTALPEILIAGVEPVAQHKLEHGLRRSPRVSSELFQTTLLCRRKRNDWHASVSVGLMTES